MRRLPLPVSGPLVAVVALGLLAGAGCSSSGSKPSSSSTTSAPEDRVVSNAEVTQGLASLATLAASAASQAETNATAAKSAASQVVEQWEKIEGRIKKNDTDAYLKFEDALSDLRTGVQDRDATKAAKGATAIATISAAYLAKFPG